MMLRLTIRSLCAVTILAQFTKVAATVQEIHGKRFTVEKEVVANIGEYLHKKKLQHKSPMTRACTTVGSSPANPLPTIEVPPTALFNPDALPGAFYPDPTISNITAAPPQTVGVNFIAIKQSNGCTLAGTPLDHVGAVGPSQVISGGNKGIISFDKLGNRDNMIDNERSSIFNLDGNFSTFLGCYDARIRYDLIANRFILADNIGLQSGQGYNGFIVAVSDSDTISDTTTWTVFTVCSATDVADSNGCPGDITNPASSGIFYD